MVLNVWEGGLSVFGTEPSQIPAAVPKFVTGIYFSKSTETLGLPSWGVGVRTG